MNSRAPLRLLVGIESVALAVLVALALRAPEAEAQPESQPAVAVHEAQPVAEAPSPAPSATRTAVTDAAPAADASTLLFGTVTRADGGQLEPCLVRAWRSDGTPTNRMLHQVERDYALAGLLPGAWEFSVTASGCREHKATIELDGQPPCLRRDVVLATAVLIKVKFVTPDGTPLQQIKDLFGPSSFRFPIVAVATRRQPAGNLPMTELRDLSRFGLGQWAYNDTDGGRSGRALALPAAWAGQLELREPPPCFVSAAYRHVVLATQSLAPGQTELSFAIDPERIKGTLASAKVRVIDARSKAPISGARVGLNDSQGGSFGTPTDAQGEIKLARLAPGPRQLSVSANGYGRVSHYVLLAPGQTEDLGAVELGAPVKLTGTVIERDGKPAAAEVLCLQLDRLAFPQPTDIAIHATAKADGSFECDGLAAGRYLVSARATGRASNVVRVDLGAGEVPPVRLVLESGVEVTLALAYGCDESYLVQAVDAAGALLWASRRAGGTVLPVRMLAGTYAIEVHDDQQMRRRIPLRVANRPVRVEVTP